MLRNLYLIGAIIGTIVPYSYFITFLVNNGLDFGLILAHIFTIPLSAFAWMDVLVSTLVLGVFVFVEGRRLEMKNLWVYIACNLLVGVSLALPLFLYVREGHLKE